MARPRRSGPRRPLGDCFLLGFVQGETSLKWLSACKLQFQPGTPPLVLLTSLLTSAQSSPTPRNLRFCTGCAVEASIRPITKNIPQDSRRAQVSLLVGRRGQNGDEVGAPPTPVLEPGLGTVAREKPGRFPGAAEGDLAERWPLTGALILDCVRGVRTPGAWEAVPKLLETCLQFRFRNFRDLCV